VFASANLRLVSASAFAWYWTQKICMATSHNYFTEETTLAPPISILHTPACGRSIVSSVERLRLHSAVESFGNLQLGEFSSESSSEIISEPILVTPNGTILSGFLRWLTAKRQGVESVDCIEYPIGEDKALDFILRTHCQRETWNAFVRIRMALTCESDFQQQALENMRLGGKYKGSADLPNASRIDVREEVARLVGVSGRNVSNVKKILLEAHPRILQALQNGTLKINRALHLCRWPQEEQIDQLIAMKITREIDKTLRHAMTEPSRKTVAASVGEVLEMLRKSDTQRPGSVQIRTVDVEQTIILLGRDVLSKTNSQETWLT
jgi:hypothetical protein